MNYVFGLNTRGRSRLKSLMMEKRSLACAVLVQVCLLDGEMASHVAGYRLSKETK